MEIFEGDDLSNEDAVSYVMVNLGWIVVLLATKDFLEFVSVVGDASGGECLETDDIFILGSLMFSLFIRRESLSLLGLLSNVPFFNNSSTLSCKRSFVMSLTIRAFLTSLCILVISAQVLVTVCACVYMCICVSVSVSVCLYVYVYTLSL